MARNNLHRSVGKDQPNTRIANTEVNGRTLVRTQQVHQNRNYGEAGIKLNVPLRGVEFFELECAGSMKSKIILLADELSEVIGEDKFRCNKFVEYANIRTKHCLPEPLLDFDNLSLKFVIHGLTNVVRLWRRCTSKLNLRSII